MCGIAGLIDLTGQRRAPAGSLRAMADAIVHRGPDEDGYFEQPGVGLASRRLSILGLHDGRQPIYNEDRSVAVVFNGELFDYPEMRAKLEARGHRFATHCDTELIPHLWEDHQEGMFDHLKGQFAFALYDSRRHLVVLGRDRFGICPLFWTRRRTADGEWLLFASEIKALLASGMVEARPDLNGINHLFTFFSMPGPVTCFEGVRALSPGRFMTVQLPAPGRVAQVNERVYWFADYPERGHEDNRRDEADVVQGLNDVLLKAVEKRLRADVPVVSYLSGGVDSSTVVALASHVRGSPIPAFTIRIKTPELDEVEQASLSARHIGTDPIIVDVGADEVLNTYPELVRAAESPVIDTSCTALLLLARSVHEHGYKVALTGEGADEWMAGYPWQRINRLMGRLDLIPGVKLSLLVRDLFFRVTRTPRFPRGYLARCREAVGGHNGWLDLYNLVSLSKLRFFSQDMKKRVLDHVPFEDLELPKERFGRWHPMHRESYLSSRVHLVGLLLNAKGDRVAMNSSVETRYPFLDEDVFAYVSKLHPDWKFRGLTEKYVLRKLAEKWLPHEIAHRRKAMFRAPFDSFHLDTVPRWVEQLLAPESLRKSGYFDAEAVAHWRAAFRALPPDSWRRTSVEMGLVGVLATQLWHHTFIDPTLADLPAHDNGAAARTWRADGPAAPLAVARSAEPLARASGT